LTGPRIYTTTATTITTNVESFGDPLAGRSDPDDSVGRDITLLDHSHAIQANPQGRFGNDVMAGGAGRDLMFGQLGNDLIQGDGEIGADDVDPATVTHSLTVIDTGTNLDTDEVPFFNIAEA